MSGGRGLLTALRGCRKGAAAVEFAIISLVMILLCVGIIDLGRTLMVRNELSFAADHAARMMMRELDNAEVEAEAQRTFRSSPADLRVTFDEVTVQSDPPISYRTVTLSYDLRPILSRLMGRELTLSAHRQVPVV